MSLEKTRLRLLAVLALALLAMGLWRARSNKYHHIATKAEHKVPSHERQDSVSGFEAEPRLAINPDLIQYVYYETDAAKINLRFFLAHALHDKADFVFILNSLCSVAIPEADNIRVVRRDNTCYDLGAHAQVLASTGGLAKYKRFILMNSSIRGPFLPRWSMGSCWSQILFSKLKGNTRMVGLTANCDRRPVPTLNGVPYGKSVRVHLQSMLLAFDSLGMASALEKMRCYTGYVDAVENGETALTAHMLDSGHDVEPIMSKYAHDAKASNKRYWETCDDINVFLPNSYGGVNVHPYDTM